MQITLIGKPGCHLCDDAREAIDRVRGDLLERGIPTTVEELDILRDAALARNYSEDIPVVLVNGRRHAIWRVDPEKLAATVERASKRRKSPFARRPAAT